MSTLENSFHSYFHDHEIERIDSATPDEVWSMMQQNPDLALRFIHHLVASNRKDVALAVLNSIPADAKEQEVDRLIGQIPEEFEYYRETGLPFKQFSYHAFTIPYVLLLAKNGYFTCSPQGSVEEMMAGSRISEEAHNYMIHLISGQI